MLQLDEVLVCDSWGRWSNLSFIRPYWAVCKQVCVCVFSIKNIWQRFMSTFVCVPKIHCAGSGLMGCERYCTWTLFHACKCPLRGVFSWALMIFNVICAQIYMSRMIHLFTLNLSHSLLRNIIVTLFIPRSSVTDALGFLGGQTLILGVANPTFLPEASLGMWLSILRVAPMHKHTNILWVWSFLPKKKVEARIWLFDDRQK